MSRINEMWSNIDLFVIILKRSWGVEIFFSTTNPFSNNEFWISQQYSTVAMGKYVINIQFGTCEGLSVPVCYAVFQEHLQDNILYFH